MGRQDMLKLAAYNRLRKVASAARVIRQNRAMQKAAADEGLPVGTADIGKMTLEQLVGAMGENLDEVLADPSARAELAKKLRKARTTGYVLAGAVPGAATLGGGITGYGLGRLIGGRTGGMVGAAGGAGLGLGLSALPGVAFGVGGGMAGRMAKELDPSGGKKDDKKDKK